VEAGSDGPSHHIHRRHVCGAAGARTALPALLATALAIDVCHRSLQWIGARRIVATGFALAAATGIVRPDHARPERLCGEPRANSLKAINKKSRAEAAASGAPDFNLSAFSA